MTIKRFLKKLSKLRYKKSGGKLHWYLRQQFSIPLTGDEKIFRVRACGREFCPITAVYYAESGRQLDDCQYACAARHLGLSGRDAKKIAVAADGGDTKLLKELLKATY